MGENPDEHTVFIRTKLGSTRFDWLVLKGNQSKKWNKTEKAEMYQHYKDELKRVQDKRANGDTGIIRLVNYE